MSSHPHNAEDKPHPESQHSAKDDLLDELESIKDLLEESSLDEDELNDGLDIDIPILDDVVSNEGSSVNSADDSLLDLTSIFDEEDFFESAVDESTDEPPVTSQQHDSEETQLNFEGLDTDIEIPSFKLFGAAEDVVIETQGIEAPIIETPAQAATEGNEPTTFDSQPVNIALEPEPEHPKSLTTNEPNQAKTDETASFSQPFEGSSPSTNEPQLGSTVMVDVDIDLLIQEIVDEFIPVIEGQLRQRLSSYPNEVLQQLAKKHLKN